MSDQTQNRHVWLQEPATESCSDHQGGALVLVPDQKLPQVLCPSSGGAEPGSNQRDFHDIQSNSAGTLYLTYHSASQVLRSLTDTKAH